MTVPCLSESSTVIMSIDPTTGRLTSAAKAAATGGLVVLPGTGAGSGFAIGGIGTKGLRVDLDGHVVDRNSRFYAGWLPGQNGVVNANVSVAAGGYVQVGDILSMNYTRLGRSNQWLEFTYSIECYVTMPSPGSHTDFWGWSVQVEVRHIVGASIGAWTEIVREDGGGPRNSFRHHLEGHQEVLVTDDLTHQVQMRLTLRGALQGFATVASYDKRYMKARGH